MTDSRSKTPASNAGYNPPADSHDKSRAQGDERNADTRVADSAVQTEPRAAAFDATAHDIAEVRDGALDSGTSPYSGRGHTDIAPRGVERIAEKAVRQIPGIVDLDARLAGLGGRGYPRVNVQLDGGSQQAAATVDIAVTWPSPVTALAAETRNLVAETIRVYTGYHVSRVNVTVGETVPGRRVTREGIRNRALVEAVVPEYYAPEVRSPEVKTGLDELRPIEVTEIVGLRDISRGEEPDVRSIETPEPVTLREVGQPHEHEVRSISTPKPQPLRAVGSPQEHEARVAKAPKQQPMRHVSAPKNHRARRVEAPKDIPARRVHAPAPRRARRVEAPKPMRLRPVGQVRPLNRISKVHTPRPARLKTPKAPPEKRLKLVSTRPKFKKRRVSVPAQQQLRHISVNSVKGHPLHVDAPQPTTLRQVEARQLDVWHPTLKPARNKEIHLKSEGGSRG